MRWDVRGIIVSVLCLTMLGCLAVYSSCGFQDVSLVWHHVGYAGVGILLLHVAIHINPQLLRDRRFFRPALVVMVALLIYVLIWGKEVMGARRWIQVFMFQFQPSSLAKPLLVLFVALKLSENIISVRRYFMGMFPVLVAVFAVSALVLLQADVSTALLLMFVGVLLIWLAGTPSVYIAGMTVPPVSGIALLFVMYPYRSQRLWAYMDPFGVRDTTGFQYIQAMVSFARGGMYGVGPGAGEQKLHYLSNTHGAFVLPLIGEELGVLATVAVLVLHLMFFLCGMHIARRCSSSFHSLLAAGLTLLTTSQAALHVMFTTGLMPTGRISLPFVSYGGTEQIVQFVSAGVLISIALWEEREALGRERHRKLEELSQSMVEPPDQKGTARTTGPGEPAVV